MRKFGPYLIFMMLVSVVGMSGFLWFFPLPDQAIRRGYANLYMENISAEHTEILDSLECVPETGGYFSRRLVYLCSIDSSCSNTISHRMIFDRFRGASHGPDQFYVRFARDCFQMLNQSSAGSALEQLDRGG